MRRSNAGAAARPRTRSSRVYARVPRERIALIKFLFEGYDNLGYVSVIDRYQAVVRITCSPDSLHEVRRVCAGMEGYGLEVIPLQARETVEGK